MILGSYFFLFEDLSNCPTASCGAMTANALNSAQFETQQDILNFAQPNEFMGYNGDFFIHANRKIVQELIDNACTVEGQVSGMHDLRPTNDYGDYEETYLTDFAVLNDSTFMICN